MTPSQSAGDYATAGEEFVAASPNGRLVLTTSYARLASGTAISYTAELDGKTVVRPSTISFLAADGSSVGTNLQGVTASGPTRYQSSWKPTYGERAIIETEATTLTLAGDDRASGMRTAVEFRIYDSGFAFKTTLETSGVDPEIRLQAELSEVRLPGNCVAWAATNAQGEYRRVALADLPNDAERPLVIQVRKDLYVGVTEAKLVDYPRSLLSLRPGSDDCLVTQLSGPVEASAALTTPWRLVLVGETPGDLVESNHLILDLNDPCEIADTSWIRPGKVIREITLTTAGGEACIDFAAEHGFGFVEFDAGWYGHEFDNASDATTVTIDPKRTPGPFDLKHLIKYADKRGIGVIVYVNHRALIKQLDDILPLYKSWGISGVKYGFVSVGSQDDTAWLHEAVRKAAAHELMVDIHDVYRPTGYSRTYPNLMTQEGVRGDEACPSAEQTLVSAFTRTLAGATDFTVCYFADRVREKWTHSHQLAKTVCIYSPWQFIYWYDTPASDPRVVRDKERILPTPEQEFFWNVPTVWDESHVLDGKIGEYAVLARRSGDEWFLGVLNAGQPRELEIGLDFLDGVTTYQATSYSDDPEVPTLTRVRIDRSTVTSDQVVRIPLLANGGYAAHLKPTAPDSQVANASGE